MKTYTNAWLELLTVLALLLAAPLASAYYDPSVQRWINRDPLGESGFEATRAWVAIMPAWTAPRATLGRPARLCLVRRGPRRTPMAKWARSSCMVLPETIHLMGLMRSDCFARVGPALSTQVERSAWSPMQRIQWPSISQGDMQSRGGQLLAHEVSIVGDVDRQSQAVRQLVARQQLGPGHREVGRPKKASRLVVDSAREPHDRVTRRVPVAHAFDDADQVYEGCRGVVVRRRGNGLADEDLSVVVDKCSSHVCPTDVGRKDKDFPLAHDRLTIGSRSTHDRLTIGSPWAHHGLTMSSRCTTRERP